MQLSTKGAKHFIDTIGQWKQTKAEEIKTERLKNACVIQHCTVTPPEQTQMEQWSCACSVSMLLKLLPQS